MDTFNSPSDKKCFSLSSWCYFALLVFVGAFFFATSSKQLNNFFYVALGIPSVIILLRHKISCLNSTYFFWMFFVFSGWIILTSLTLSEQTADTLKALKPILYIFFLAVIIFFLSQKKSNLPVTFIFTILIAAAISGAWLLYNFYEPRHWNFGRRLHGDKAISNSIWVGAIYGLAALISVILFLRQKTLIQQVSMLLLGIIPFAVMLLSQSRGPIVAFIIAFFYTLTLFRNRRSFFIVAVTIMGAFLVYFNFSELTDSTRMFRGDSYRLGIWKNAVAAIADSPFFGHGITAETQNFIGKKSFDHYHNVYLTIAFQSGIIGFLLFPTLAVTPLLLNKTPNGILLKPLLIFGMVYMAFNGSNLFSSPKELWLIFWIPLLLLWAYSPQNKLLKSESSPSKKLIS